MPRGLIYHGETRQLDQRARSQAPGKFIQLPEGFVHYQLEGDSTGRTVVLIPGFSVPYPIWDPTFPALVQAGFRVLRYDLYGRGYSDRPDISYDLDLFDRQLIDLLAALRIQAPVDLIGLSLGGAIAVLFTARHPAQVRNLGLIDPAGLPWPQALPARLGKAPLLGEVVLGLLGGRVLVSNLADYFFGEQDYGDLKRAFLDQMAYVGFKKALLSSLRNGITTGAQDAYREVGGKGHPVLLIWGEEDQVVPFRLNEKVRELIPQAEFHPVKAAAHIPHYQHPELVNPLLIDFLTR